ETKLYLSYALTRYRFGRLKTCEPSRFLEEIDKDFIKFNQKMSSTPSPGDQYAKTFISNVQRTAPKPPPNQLIHKPSANFRPSDTSKLAIGNKVEHPKFGFGEVTEIDVQGANKKAHISFEKAGDKTLLLSFAKLRIVS
ncbi:MAG: ATP-dependent DNA helicase, partial [Reichenbachiella sp.]